MLRLSCLKLAGIIVFCSAMAQASFAQTYDVLTSFTGPNGGDPFGPLVQGVDGKLYGTTFVDGPIGAGTVFRITTGGQSTTLSGFCNSSKCAATNPEVGVLQGSDGYIYGTTSGFDCINLGYSCATVFKMSRSGGLGILHTFTGSDGSPAEDGLVQSADSALFGVLDISMLSGSAYTITPTGSYTKLADLNGEPSGITQSPQGDFYISLYYGGAHGFGAVQRMSPDGSVSTVYDFCPKTGCLDGQYVGASVVVGSDGNIYGTTAEGGSTFGGTVFKLNPTGKLTILHNFCMQTSCVDGEYPLGLVQGNDGNFYGVTFYGGPNQGDILSGGAGILYKITPTGTFTPLYSFCSQTNCADGSNPFAGLLQATNGKFYGTTSYGGSNASGCQPFVSYGPCGTVFGLSVGLGAFVALPINTAPAGTTVGILGQGFTGATGVTFNGTPASFTVLGDTYITATVPAGATSGRVKVTTSGGSLASNRPFYVQP